MSERATFEQRMGEAEKARMAMKRPQRDLLNLTADEIAALPIQTLRALERRGLAELRGQRWKLTAKGRLARVMQQSEREGADDG